MIGLLELEEDLKKKEYLKRLRYTYQKCLIDMNLSKIKETDLLEFGMKGMLIKKMKIICFYSINHQ